MTMIEDCLFAHAEATPDKTAICCGSRRLTYAELAEDVKLEADRLSGCGDACQVVLLPCTQDERFVITYLAAHVAGKTCVPLEAGIPSATLDALRRQCLSAPLPPHTADVLFTTGTTGRRKGVMISHTALLADAENLAEAHGFTSATVFVVCGPMSHIGSLSKLYPLLLQGGTLILLKSLSDMNAFFDAFTAKERCMATFLVPASIHMLLQFGADRLSALADRLDFIETGAAPLGQADMKTLCRLLPHTRLYNTYASTETGIISTFDFNAGEPLPGCLGKPMKHARLRITDEGHVACAGPTLMSGYLGDTRLTQEVMHDGWLITSDLGTIDEKGRLRLQGREGDTINVGGYKVAPAEVEDAALSFPALADCICLPADSPLFGRCLRLLFSVKQGARVSKRDLARHIASKVEPYKVPRIFEQVDAVRRTFNGKLDRKSYLQE